MCALSYIADNGHKPERAVPYHHTLVMAIMTAIILGVTFGLAVALILAPLRNILWG